MVSIKIKKAMNGFVAEIGGDSEQLVILKDVGKVHELIENTWGVKRNPIQGIDIKVAVKNPWPLYIFGHNIQ